MSRQAALRSNLPARVAETPLTPQPPALVLFGRDGAKFRAAWFAASDVEAATAAAATMKLRALPLGDEAGRSLARMLPAGRILPSARALVPFTKRDLYARLTALAPEPAGPSEAAQRATDQAEDAPQAKAEPAAGGDASTVSASTVNDAAEPGAAEAEPARVETGSCSDDKRSEAATPAATDAPARPGDKRFVGEVQPSARSEIGLGSIVLAHESPDEGWWEAEVIGCNGRVFSLRWRDYPTQPTILRKAGELALLPPGDATAD